eukprot:614421_1
MTYPLTSTVSTQLLLWAFVLIIFVRIPLNAVNDVESISFRTSRDHAADTEGTITVTLWFNYTIYEYSVSRPGTDTTYTAYRQSSPEFTVLGLSECPPFSHGSEAKVMIQNDNKNGVYMEYVRFDTTSGDYYNIERICIPSGAVPYGWTDNTHSVWKLSDSVCPDGHDHFEAFCIDIESNDCQPAKQMLTFDPSLPNQDIQDALWSDATSVSPIAKTCTTESNVPSASPSLLTIHPSKTPSKEPTLPTLYPTTGRPTKSPVTSAPVTATPTQDPTIVIQTIHPSKDPTADPTFTDTTDTVTTNYEVSIEIKHCDEDTECEISSDVIDEVVKSVLPTLGMVEIAEVMVIEEHLVIRLSVTTDSDNVLETDTITYHIEREIKDQSIADLGEVETEEMSTDFHDIEEDDEGLFSYFSSENILIGAIFVFVICCAIVWTCHCKGRKRTQQQMSEKQALQASKGKDSGNSVVTDAMHITASRSGNDDGVPMETVIPGTVTEDVLDKEGEINRCSFDAMFVDVCEKSVSKSEQNEALNEETTKGEDYSYQKDKVSFHGTKGDHYDEYHHQIYKGRSEVHHKTSYISIYVAFRLW